MSKQIKKRTNNILTEHRILIITKDTKPNGPEKLPPRFTYVTIKKTKTNRTYKVQTETRQKKIKHHETMQDPQIQ
jgi:hypothetical protein